MIGVAKERLIKESQPDTFAAEEAAKEEARVAGEIQRRKGGRMGLLATPGGGRGDVSAALLGRQKLLGAG